MNPLTPTEPSYLYSTSSTSLRMHLAELGTLLDHLMERWDMEPDSIITDWRDGGGGGEHSGWMSVVKWPVKVMAKR